MGTTTTAPTICILMYALIRGCVRPSVRWSVRPSVRDAFVRIAENGVMLDLGAPDFRKVGLSTLLLVGMLLGPYEGRKSRIWHYRFHPNLRQRPQSWQNWPKLSEMMFFGRKIIKGF